MKTIWKFPLEVTDHQAIDMPEGAKLLSCQPQNGGLCLWALVESEAPVVPRLILINGTGHPFQVDGHPASTVNLEFIDTAIMHGGALVWHVFDAGEMANTGGQKQIEPRSDQ